MRQICQPSPLYDHSQLHDRQAAPSGLCCCCADVVVLYARHVRVPPLCIPKLCSCFTLELGAVRASSRKNLQQFYCCVVPPVVAHLKKSKLRAMLLVLRAVLLPVRRRRRRCCAAVVVLRSSCMCASALYSQVVQFHLGVGSCACILPQKSTVLLLCSPTCSYCCSPLKKKMQGLIGILKCIAQTKMKGKSRRRHRCRLCCYCCSFTASAVLCCCCCVTFIIWVCFVFRLLRRFTTVLPAVPAVAHKIYVRKTTVLEN